jgi:glycosyltransferase involved in cell wall biosynthesis
MTILFGHPTGSPFSHQAALAHQEAGRLEAFCVPWMPTLGELSWLGKIPPLSAHAARLERRYFQPLASSPKVEGRVGEWARMARRIAGGPWADERLSYEANDWLMRTMRRECRRPGVKAVHAYEDCSLWQFEESKRLGKACVYDMPIGYYPAWEETQTRLAAEFSDWLPKGGLPSSRWVRPRQKQREMELADLVLVPGSFVKKTIDDYIEKPTALAPYAVDAGFWHPTDRTRNDGPLTFLFAGQISIRKGLPVLLKAWRRAGLKDARLELVGMWNLTPSRQRELPAGVSYQGPCSSESLRGIFRQSDVFVFPSFFEGFGLVILEAMACGLPVIATDATAGVDLLDENTGRVFAAGDEDALVDNLRWFADNRDRLPAMGRAARAKAETCTWEQYRWRVGDAVARLD